MDGLRSPVSPITEASTDEPQSVQLNLKMDQGQLDAFKARARDLRRPYHALGRQYIEAAFEREERELGIATSSASA